MMQFFFHKTALVQLFLYHYIILANSLEYPQRIEIEWSQCLNSVFVCLFFACQSANFLIFIQYSTEECSTVQLFFYKIIAVMIDIDSSWECIAVYGPVQYSIGRTWSWPVMSAVPAHISLSNLMTYLCQS